ncbi:MFS transporter [Microbacterium sp. YJN-G]|uniref:MFS transporter n=1 Tax=Microbacterium sp. YJN-G TaxID=2763257 RepID=UPI001878E43A|nr:MFS transporter [Microbacterium sp. YJN-G]
MPGAERSDARQRLIVAVLAFCGLVGSVQFTLMVPVLPQIPLLLGTTAGDATWLVTVTLLVATIGTPVMARLADMHGRRRLLIIAMVLLVVGSVLAAVTDSFTLILIGRGLQGFASSALPIGIGLLSGLVDTARTRLGVALMSGTLALGSGFGLTVAGPLVTLWGLPSIFWISAVTGGALIVLLVLFVDEAAVRDPGRFDIVGTLLLAVGLSLILLVLSRIASWGLTLLSVGAVLTGILALGLWWPWERRHPSPVIDVSVSLRSPVAQINIASFFATLGMYANHLVTMQEALAPHSTGYGLDLPLAAAGLILVPSSLAGLVLSPPAARLISRHGPRRTLMLGTAIMAAAYAYRSLQHADLTQLLIGTTLVGIGTAFAFAAMPSLIIDAVGPRHVSAANGVNSLARSLSGAVASAAFALALVLLPAASDAIYLSETGLLACLITAGVSAAVAALLALRLPSPERMP